MRGGSRARECPGAVPGVMSRRGARTLLAVAAFAAMWFAGCAGSPEASEPASSGEPGGVDDGSAPPGSFPAGLPAETGDVRAVECTGAHLAFFVPADRAQAVLPPGLHAAGAPHESLAQVQLRHATCGRLIVDNATEFDGFREVQLWIHVVPPDDSKPPADWLSYYALKVWQAGVPLELFEAKGLPVGAGEYAQTTETLVPDAWAWTTGTFEPADEQEAWRFDVLSDDLPVVRTEHYRAFYGDDLRYYDLFVEGRIANQDYGGVLLTEEGSTLSSLSGTGSVNLELGGIFEEIVLSTTFHAE